MLRRSALATWVLLAACGPLLYSSRVPYPPLLAKLSAAGGDPARVIHPTRAADLAALEDGRRYKFAVLGAGGLAIAPLPADARDNEYVHPVLGGGEAVRTAGGLRVERAGGRISAVVVDQDSKSYCPSFGSLAAAERALVGIGVQPGVIRREDRPPSCPPRP